MRTLVPLVLVATVLGVSQGKIFEKCELATLLEKVHGFPREEIKKWVCIAQYESTFNTQAVNEFNWNGSKDYGLFQLNNKYWCGSNYGKNECNMPCSDLLDDDLTDDVTCIRKIIKDTEKWKGRGTGYTAWVAYTSRCQNRDLDAYMSECWSDPLSSNSIGIRDVPADRPTSGQEEEETSGGGYPIINNARVPIRSNSIPRYWPLYQYVVPTPRATAPSFFRSIFPFRFQ